jgi:hemolysin activation/secretion protein
LIITVRVRRAVLSLLLLAALPAVTLAQQAPLVTPRDLRPETQTAPAAPLPQPAPADIPPESEKLFVTVKDIQVSGSYPEFIADTAALVGPLAGKRIAAAEFYRLAQTIEALYRDAGYLLVRVLVPPQTINDGQSLQLTVLDGFIEILDLDALPPRARPQVQATLQGVVGQRRLTNDRLERVLTLAGRGPGLGLRSTLAPGTAPGAVILVLDGSFDPVGASLSADNRSSKTLGPWQSTLQLRANQLLGRGEQTYVYASGGINPTRAFRSDAPRRVIGGGVIIPLGVDGLSLNPEATWSDTITPGSGFVPTTESKFQRYTLRLLYPLVLTRQQELNLSGALEATGQTNLAPDFDATLNQDRLRVLRLGADWSAEAAFDPAGRIRISSTLSKGFSRLGARTQADADASGIPLSRPGADPAFLKVEAAAAYDHSFASGIQSKTGLRLQKARKLLPSAELFSLDGEDALSMFRSGSLSDDNGWTLRQEVSRSVSVTVAGAAAAFLPYAFAAVGRGYGGGPGPSARGPASSYGVGLKAAWRNVNLSMEYGRRQSRPHDFDGTQFFLKGQVQF